MIATVIEGPYFYLASISKNTLHFRQNILCDSQVFWMCHKNPYQTTAFCEKLFPLLIVGFRIQENQVTYLCKGPGYTSLKANYETLILKDPFMLCLRGSCQYFGSRPSFS